MNYVISGYEPKAMFEFFEQISAIPRGSGNEAGIAAFLEKFASERNIFCIKDEKNNVFMRLPATPGREREAAVMLQGHTDMVCEKNADTVHDFLSDPLKLYVEDGWLRARGTTLGADNGIAVAAMLAILDGACASHPALEFLFTVDEEVGLLGAGSFDYSVVTAKKLINLDSEDEGAVIVGCAGGMRSDLTLDYKVIPYRGETLKISVTGLCGGHSGENINSGRANAIKLMGRLLATLAGKMRVNIISVSGGSKDNAIPREAWAEISVANAERAARAIMHETKRLRGEFSADDAGLVVGCSVGCEYDEMLSPAHSRAVIAALACVQNGVIEMSRKVSGLVGFSRNLGVLTTDTASKQIKLVFSSRSSVESQIDASATELDALASALGFKSRHYARYPGWDYADRSPLRDKYIEIAHELFGKEPVVKVIHAGLECGIIKNKLPRLDIISVGPNMKGIHSPDEALDLASSERFMELIARLLA